MRHAFLRLIGLLCCLLPLLAWAEPATVPGLLDIPPLKARVTDLTGTLTPPDIEALEYRLRVFEERKGAQLVVLILPTTQPETIEQFGIRLFDAWKLGRKGVDDGVMLIVAKDDRKLRIEVGYGLEGTLSDATAKRIIEELIVPRFKEGDVPGGVQAGVQAIIKVVDGEALPANTQAAPFAGGYLQDVTLPDELGFVFLAAVILGGPTLRLILGSLLGSAIVAVVCGTAGWLSLGGWMGFASGAVMGLLLSFLLRGGRRSSGGSGVFGNILGGILSLIFGGGGGGGGFGGRGGSGGGGGASGGW